MCAAGGAFIAIGLWYLGEKILQASKNIANKDSLESELAKYKEPYDYEKIVSSDVGNSVGYIEGHAWIGRVKANTTYEILVIEKEQTINRKNNE